MRRLNDIPSRRRWVFHLRGTCDLVGTYRETSLRRRHDVFVPSGYSPLNRDNLTQHIQMELSKKQKTFPQFFFFFFFFAFLKSSLNFEHFQKKDDPHS